MCYHCYVSTCTCTRGVAWPACCWTIYLTSWFLDGGRVQRVAFSLTAAVLLCWWYLLTLHDVNLVLHLNAHNTLVEFRHKWMLQGEREWIVYFEIRTNYVCTSLALLLSLSITFPSSPSSPPHTRTLSSSSDVGLLVESFVRHWSVKLTNLGLHLLVCFKRGAGFLGMRKRARIGCMLQRAGGKRCVWGGWVWGRKMATRDEEWWYLITK